MNKAVDRFLRAIVVTVAVSMVSVPSNAENQRIAQSRLDAISTVIQTQVAAGKLAGAVTMVAQHGEVLETKSFGFQSLEENLPMSTDTIFRIFSMTKPVAGTALMKLYDEGKFQLSDPVEKYIPEFVGLQVAKADGPDGIPSTEPQQHKMTIRELMSHSGGLTYGFFSRSQVDTLYQKVGVLDRNSTLKQMVTKLGKIPLRQQPGTLWHYSVSVDVQGYLVEVLSGKTFDQYLQDNIFSPLGMLDTGFYVSADKANRLSRYYGSDNTGKQVSTANAEYLTKPALFSGGGGLVSTAADYMRFAQMHLNGGELGGVRILSAAAVDLMRMDQLPEGVAPQGAMVTGGVGFGLDFAIAMDSEKALGQPVGTYWWWGIAGTWFWIDPVNELIFIGMIQTRNVPQAVGLHRRSKHLMYGTR